MQLEVIIGLVCLSSFDFIYTLTYSLINHFPFSLVAPELFDGEKNSKESDVYAFGMVCFEIITRRIPFQDLPQYQLYKLISEGKRELDLIPSETPEILRKVMELCWNQSPSQRPAIREVLKLLSMQLLDLDNGILFNETANNSTTTQILVNENKHDNFPIFTTSPEKSIEHISDWRQMIPANVTTPVMSNYMAGRNFGKEEIEHDQSHQS